MHLVNVFPFDIVFGLLIKERHGKHDFVKISIWSVNMAISARRKATGKSDSSRYPDQSGAED